jgi:hypothetical protein
MTRNLYKCSLKQSTPPDMYTYMYIMNEVLGLGLLGRTEYETHQQAFCFRIF